MKKLQSAVLRPLLPSGIDFTYSHNPELGWHKDRALAKACCKTSDFQIRARSRQKVRGGAVVYPPYAGCHLDFRDLQPDKVAQGADIYPGVREIQAEVGRQGPSSQNAMTHIGGKEKFLRTGSIAN